MPEKDRMELLEKQLAKTGAELRAFTFEMRAKQDEEHGKFIEGVPIVFDQKTDIAGLWEETVDRGALDKTDLTDVRFLVNHNTDMVPLARSRNNTKNSTMQMTVEEDGMKIRVNLDTENNSEARNLYSAIERGDVSGMSFMFTVRGDKWDNLDTDYPTRHITDIEKVYEVSAVTFPAYEQTSINARSREKLESTRAALDSARAEARKAEEEAKQRAERMKLESEERSRKLALLEFETN